MEIYKAQTIRNWNTLIASKKAIEARNKRVNKSTKSNLNRKKHYETYLKKKAYNIKNNIAPSNIELDERGYRV